MSEEFRFSNLSGNFPPFIPRVEIQKYFPWLSPKRMANLDSLGAGPAVSVKNGRAIIYPTKALLDWLDSRNGDVVEVKVSAPFEPDIQNHEEDGGLQKRRGRKRKWQEVRERRGLA